MESIGYTIGRFVGCLIFPILILGIIALIQFVRTRDRQAAVRAATTWWALLAAFACAGLGLFGIAVQNLR